MAPDSRLSLNSAYPAALDDCHEALLWMKDYADELGINAKLIMVVGESAGGRIS